MHFVSICFFPLKNSIVWHPSYFLWTLFPIFLLECGQKTFIVSVSRETASTNGEGVAGVTMETAYMQQIKRCKVSENGTEEWEREREKGGGIKEMFWIWVKFQNHLLCKWECKTERDGEIFRWRERERKRWFLDL